MANSRETRDILNWSYNAFTGTNTQTPSSFVRIKSNKQDHSVLHFGESTIDTPIKIGRLSFKRGLGTHANSEITLGLPAGSKAFQASIGIDNNHDTQGRNGSVQFVVIVEGKELFRSATLRGGNAPVQINVALPPHTSELTLKVDGTPDGVSCDQADWADARVILDNGGVAWADEDRQIFLAPQLPFSFIYDGKPFAQLEPQWTRTGNTVMKHERVLHNVQFSDPQTGLQVTATATVFLPYAAVEWVLNFENKGTKDTPIIENIQAIDTLLASGYFATPAIVHRLSGDVCGEQSFTPIDTTLESGKPLAIAPDGGRSSSGAFPFFDFEYNGKGIISAIGWTGQWQARFDRFPTGPTHFTAGMEKTHFILHPGESVRSPRILIMPWEGDRIVAHQRFRRLLMFEYTPKANGHPLRLPIALQCFDRYVGTSPKWSTEAGQFRAAQATRDIGCDTHWLDAAWFPNGFPEGAGNWFCSSNFPNGLKPLSDRCHSMGLKFLLWFEPERVVTNTAIAREHPEFLLKGGNSSLYNLGDPAARRWLTDLLSKRITEFGLDTYRNDFNIDPLGFWRANDAPDRQGISEIRYIEGLYAMWDELLAKHPGLWIDNCASGGRRIDIEMISRSVNLWRSDTGCAPGHADWDQNQAMSVSQYIPLFTSCSWEHTAYPLRSTATAGVICQFDFQNTEFSTNAARTALAEIKENQKYWYGDFTPLTPNTVGSQSLVAYQLHRADLNSGIILAFRRADCPYPAVQVSLKGLSPDKYYRVMFIDEARHKHRKIISGKALTSNFELRLPEKQQSLLIRYQVK